MILLTLLVFIVNICFLLSVVVVCTYSQSLMQSASTFGLLAVLPSTIVLVITDCIVSSWN